MKRWLIGIYVLIAWPNALLAQAPKAVDWKEYSSTEGKFSILLPGTPTTGRRHAGEDSPDSVTYVVNVQLGQQAWSVAYFDEPSEPTNVEAIKKLFDRTRKYRERSEYHHLVSEKDYEVSGYPARDLKIRFDYDKKRIELTRIILVKQRVYEVTLVTFAGSTDTEDVRRYFDSFKAQPLTAEEIKALKSFSAEEKAKAVPRKIKVSSGVLQGQAARKVMPAYTLELQQSGLAGDVEVSILVSEQGQVLEAQAIKGPEPLWPAAVEAAKQWTFKPVTLGGYPVQMEGVLTFKFIVK